MNRVSKKLRKKIFDAVSSAFTDTVSEYECYDFPPEVWLEHERELWDVLCKMQSRIVKNLETII